MRATFFISALIATFTSATYAQQCVGQGEGNFQGVLVCWIEVLCDSIDCEFDVYDSYCNKIAAHPGPNVGDAIDSELPYTVDISQLDQNVNLDLISAHWWYAGGHYGKGITNSVSQSSKGNGFAPMYWVRAAFPCSA